MTNRVRSAILLSALTCMLGASANANSETVAVPNFKGKSKKVKAKVARAIRAELRAADYSVLGPKSLKKAARIAGTGVRSLEAAREGGAAVLILGKVSGRKKKKVAVRVLDVANGQEITSFERKLKSSKRAKKLGKSLGRKIAKAIEEHLENQNEAPVSKPRVISAGNDSNNSAPSETSTDDEFPDENKADEFPDESSSSRVRSSEATNSSSSVIPKDEIEETETPQKRPRVLVVSDDDTEKSDADNEPDLAPKESTGSNRLGLQIDLEGGLLARHQYTVSVGNYATGLSYGLAGIPSLGGRLSYTSPFAGLGIDVYGYFEPFAYNVAAVVPALDPVNPSGDFINLGGSVHWNLKLSSSFALRTLLGVEQTSMSVQEQFTAETMQPSSVVLSWTSLRPFLGVMGTISLLKGHLDLSFNTAYKLVSSYTEQPFFTGEFSSGYDVVAGTGVRYWFNSTLGGFIRAEYEYKHVAFEGEGNRLLFDSDKGPDALNADRLNNAVADHDWLRIYLGLSMSF